MAGIVFAFIDAEIYYSNYRNTGSLKSEPVNHFLRSLVLVLTLALDITLIRHHYFKFTIKREKQSTSEIGSSFLKSSNIYWTYLEIIVNSLICPPGLDYQFNFSQLHGVLKLSLVAIMSDLMLLRCYIIVRAVRHFSKWGNMESEEICDNAGCEASHRFMLKAMFKEKPYLILVSSMSLSIIIFGFAVRTIERPYNDDNGNEQNYDYVWNSMWLVVITMCTVGYGDFFPRTHIGRFIIVIACFYGIFLISMMVVTLTESSEFTKSESRAFEILSRLKRKEEAKKTAGRVVYMALRINYYKKYGKNDLDFNKNKAIMNDQLKRILAQFKVEQQDWKQWDLPIEEMLRQLTEKLDLDIEELRNKIYTIVDIDHQLQRVEKFQEESLNATTVSLAYLVELETKIDSLIEKN